jgi:hypothetical protein
VQGGAFCRSGLAGATWRWMVVAASLAPLQALRGRQGVPLAYQLFALCRWQLLKAFEGVVQLLALRRWQLIELADVFARLLPFFRRHLLPAGNALANFLAFLRRQGDPVLGPLQHARLLAWWHAVPLLPQRRQHFALGRIEAAPRVCRRILRMQRHGHDTAKQRGQQRWEERA